MEWEGLVDSVNRLSCQLDLIQEYISVKFGLDFQQFCENKSCSLQKLSNSETPPPPPSSQTPTSTPTRSTRSTPKLLEEEDVEYHIKLEHEPGDADAGHAVENVVESSLGAVIPFSGGRKGAENLISDYEGEGEMEEDEWLLPHDVEYDAHADDSDKVVVEVDKSFKPPEVPFSRGIKHSRALFPAPKRPEKKLENCQRRRKRTEKIVPGKPDRHAHLRISYFTTKTGKERLLYDGFVYKCYNAKEDGRRYWTCDLKNCASKLAQRVDGKVKLTKLHSHPPLSPGTSPGSKKAWKTS